MAEHPADDPRHRPDLDGWLPDASLRLMARREVHAAPERVWTAAQTIPIGDTGMLGRLIRWRIPGTTAEVAFGSLFREPPFVVLEEGERHLVSGLVGRIWTLRRDYPRLADAAAFVAHNERGTARVAFGHWLEPASGGRWALASEARVEPIGLQGRLGVAAIRPLVHRFGHLVGSEGLAAAARRAECDFSGTSRRPGDGGG